MHTRIYQFRIYVYFLLECSRMCMDLDMHGMSYIASQHVIVSNECMLRLSY